MISYQIEETIKRPIPEVFSYVGDPTLHPQWSDVRWGRLGLKGWQRVLEPFMRGDVQRGEAAELRRLNDLLERPS
jgi:hypothetical protein